MPELALSLPGSTDQFVLADRPAITLTDRYRPLPDGMTLGHATVVRAHQVRPDDVVVAFFTDGPGTRHAEHVPQAFTAHPRPFGSCPAQCEECEDIHTHGADADRYLCLDDADDREDCVIVYRNTPVAIIPAATAASLPPLGSAPLLPDLFTLDDGESGPYEALPVPRAFGPWDTISVTRATAEQIAADVATSHTGRHLTCQWLHDALLISSDPRLRTEPGRPGRLIRPDADGRYRIGGLWPWEEWSPPTCPDCSTATEPVDVEDERVWRCTAADCNRRTYGTGDPDDDETLPSYTETDADGATIVYHGTGEIDIETTAELASQDRPHEDGQDADEDDGLMCPNSNRPPECTEIDPCEACAQDEDEEAAMIEASMGLRRAPTLSRGDQPDTADTYEVIVLRTERISFTLTASSVQDATDHYLIDGDETASTTTATSIETVRRLTQPPTSV
ncbi:hypothetical protein [Streptomyces tropicalis]|uniref:Uncharacterized protein n=1 Tax=Streptomyces tropicalis TaxID=3034234 RepID=A0ABT6AEJ2_9ACTN|nr:hypothetical protein [Streptomyces tropicalis]MDF3303070.1 hypothetical protein [Streptomyces tropicalis]